MKTPFLPMFRALRSLPAVITLSLAGIGAASAQTNGTWTSTTSGNWSDPLNWSAGSVASGATFTADFSTLDITANTTVTLDSAFTIGKILAGDLTTASHNWIFDGAGILTLDNGASAPVVTVTSQTTTISAPLAGTQGFSKAGAGTLVLSGNNSGLSGTLTIEDVAGTNNHGVVLTNNNAIGGITTINILGTSGSPLTGGFLQLDGGVTLPDTVDITLNSPGGNNFPPGGIRSSGAGTVNTINGEISVTLNNSRISNNSAQRLDIDGAITGGSNAIVFRYAANEGIRLKNTGNLWTGQTQAHEGIFWFEPGCLPPNSNLSIGNSGNTSIQTKGTFTRSLGTGGTQAQFVLSASRAMGFSARGGDLTVNFGGAGAPVLFETVTGAAATNIRTSVLWLNNATADAKLKVLNPLDLNGAARTVRVDANVAELAGGITGATTLSKTGAGTLLLSTPGIWTGDLTIASGSRGNAGVVRLTHNEALGAPATVKNVNTTGDNQARGILELPGGISIDDNKTLKMGGKVFYGNGRTEIGDQSALLNIGSNTWNGSIVVASTGGAYGIESASGTLTLGASPATTEVMRNEVTGDNIRTLSWFGAGDVVMNLKMADNGSSNFNFTKIGSGKLSITRGDNDFDQAPNLRSGITEVVKLADSGIPSSLGTGSVSANINLGATLRYLGAGDTCGRPIGIVQTGATLDSSGTGPLVLSSASMSHQTGTTVTACAPFSLGATTLLVNDPSGIAVGQTITGTNIPAGTTITSVNVDTRELGISQGTTAASTTGLDMTIGGANNVDRTLTLAGSNTGDNFFAADLSNPAGTGKLGIAKTGTGTWLLTGATKTNSGPVSVQAGKLGFVNSVPSGFFPTVSAAATLSLNNVTLPDGLPAIDIDGTLDLAGNVHVNLPGNPAPGTYPVFEYGALTGGGSVTTNYRTSSFTAGANAGTLTVGAGSALTWTGAAGSDWDVAGALNWQNSTPAADKFYWLDSVVFDTTGSAFPNVSIVGEVRPNSITVNEATADYSFSGTGFISGTGGLVKSGAAALTIGTANTFTGGVTVNGGTLRAGNSAALGGIGQAVTIAAGATLDTNGSLTANRDYAATISGIGTDGAGAIVNLGADHNNGFASLTLADNATIGGTGRWDVRPITAGTGLVDLNGKTLTKTGSNQIALVDGNLTNDGVIDIDVGILNFTRMVVSGTGNVNVKSGATLRFENTSTGSWTGKPVTLDNGSVNLIGSSNFTLDAGITVTNTGTFDVAAGRFLTIPQVVTGTGGIATGPGTGTVVMNGENDYAGTTQINAGTLLFGNRTTTGKPGAGDIINNGTLRFARADSTTIANNISGTGGVIIGAALAVDPVEYDAITTLTGNNTFAGNITIYSGGLKIQDETALGTGPKTISMNYGTNGRPQFYLDGSGGDITVPADIGFVTSTNQVTHPAIGNIAGNNTIAGNITLQSGGGDTRVDVQGGSLTFSGQIAAGASGRNLRLAGATGTQGVLSGKLTNGTNLWNLVIVGSNTWTITGETNDFTGTTTVSGGTLLANNASGSATGAGAVTVATATFGGTGAVSGSVTVNGGGILSPGANGIESLATGALTLNDTSTLAIDIHTGSVTNDQVLVTGNVDLAGTVNLTLNDLGANAVLPAGTKLVVVDYTGVWDDTDIVHFNGNPVPNGSTITFGANTFTVDYSDDALGGTAMTLTTPGVANPYTDWADSFSLVGADRAPTADPDNDGLDNGIEFVIGSNPNTNTPASARPSATVIGSNLVFTFKRSDASEAFDVFVEHGTTLAAWPGQILVPVVDTEGPPVDVADNGPSTLDDVTVTIPMGTDTKKFARLRADIPYTP